MHITPHVAQNDTNRSNAIDERTTRYGSYQVSQQKRKRVEQSFAWMKVIGLLRKVKLRGFEKVGWLLTFTGAAYNLCRLRRLLVETWACRRWQDISLKAPSSYFGKCLSNDLR
jgi:hypothetical protein